MLLIDRLHKKWMLRCLKKAKGNKTLASDLLGVCRRTWQAWEIKYKMRPKRIPRHTGSWKHYDNK